jgi:hypothetical protein
MGQFEVGHKRSGGRPKGSLNKLTRELRESFHGAIEEFEHGGKKGHAAFWAWAFENHPDEFVRMAARLTVPNNPNLLQVAVNGDNTDIKVQWLDERIAEARKRVMQDSSTAGVWTPAATEPAAREGLIIDQEPDTPADDEPRENDDAGSTRWPGWTDDI